MVPAGIEAMHLAVQHKGQPGERVPVRRMVVAKRPGEPRGGQAVCNRRILVHILVIIVVDKLVLQGLSKDHRDS